MKVNNKLQLIMFIILFLPFQISEVDAEEYSALQCKDTFPMFPICVTLMGGYSDLMAGQIVGFDQCRNEVISYISEIKSQAICYETELESYTNAILNSVNDRIMCEREVIMEIENGKELSVCNQVTIPDLPRLLQYNATDYIRAIDPPNFINSIACDKYMNSNDAEWHNMCVEDLFRISSDLQDYFDNNMDILLHGNNTWWRSKGIIKMIDDVTDEFNCKASGQNVCFTY